MTINNQESVAVILAGMNVATVVSSAARRQTFC